MLSASRIHVRITGVRPLIMHSSRLIDPLDSITKEISRIARKRARTEADHERIAFLEWRGGLWTDSGRPCIPAEAIEAALVAAARTRKLGKRAQAALMCPANALLVYDGPKDLDSLWGDKRFRLRAPVQVSQRRFMRTRPRFPEWSAEIVVEYLPTVLNEEAVCEMVRIAGDLVGLGDWRPRFGRFAAEFISARR